MLDFVLGLIGTLMYPVFSIIFVCIDGIQYLFYAFAGIDNMTFGNQTITSTNSGAETETGIVYYLFSNSLVKNMLISIMLLALFLIIIFTVMAFIKNAYSAKQKGWKEIIGNSIKGLANFIFLPVCCFLGVWLANILLQAINGATNNGGTVQMSRKLFIASVYNSNQFRLEDSKPGDKKTAEDWEDLYNFAVDQGYEGADKIKAGLTIEEYANIVDEIYSTTNVAIWNQISVGKWYQVWSINYLVLIVGGIFMLYVLCSLAFAMVRRLFVLIILFVISPGVCALYPLDEGKAVQSWSGEVKKQVLSAYGAVAGLNIFFSLMPLIDKIELFTGGINIAGNFGGINNLVQIFILTVGLMCVKEVIGLISGFVGGEDALGKGASLMKESKEKVKSGAKKATRFAGTVSPYAAGAAKTFFDVNAAMGKSIGSGVSKGVDKAKAHHEENKALSYAKRNDMYKTDAEGNVVDEYDTAAARKAMEAEKKKKADDKINKRYGITPREDGNYDFTEKGLKRLNKDTERAENRKEREEKRQARSEERAKKQKENQAWKEGRAKRLESGTATLGDTFADAWSKTKKGARSAIRTAFDESGLGKFSSELSDKFYAGRAAVGKRDKAISAGPGGTKAAASAMKKAIDSGDYDGSTIVTKGGTVGEAALNLVLKDGKIEINGAEVDIKKSTGIDTKSPTAKEDLGYFDQVLNKLQNYQENINSAKTPELRAEYLKAAIKYASDVDPQGNEQLQQAIQESMKQFVKAQTENDKAIKEGKTAVEIDSPIRLEETTVKQLAQASKAIGDAIEKTVSQNVRNVIGEIRKINEKNKS